MIKKVTQILKGVECIDSVALSWFDMQKPNLSAVSKSGVEFVIKAKFTHLHVCDILVCEDGYAIEVIRAMDNIWVFEFGEPLEFAKIAYEVGNHHLPIMLEQNRITILDGVEATSIIKKTDTKATLQRGYFEPNGKSKHTH